MICAPSIFPRSHMQAKHEKSAKTQSSDPGGEGGGRVKQKSPFTRKLPPPKTQYGQWGKTATAERHARPRIIKKYTCKICLAFSESLFFFFSRFKWGAEFRSFHTPPHPLDHHDPFTAASGPRTDCHHSRSVVGGVMCGGYVCWCEIDACPLMMW